MIRSAAVTTSCAIASRTVRVQRRHPRYRPVGHRDRADRRAAPQRQLRVAVLADDVGVHALHRHPRVPGEQDPQARAVEHGARAEDPLPGQPGELLRGVGEHVDRVGDHEDDRVRGQLDQLRDQLAAHLDVDPGQLQPGLARFLLRAGGHHDDVGPRRHRDVVGAHHMGHGHELDALLQVQHLGGGLVGVQVEERDRAGDAADQAGVGDRRADAAGPHDRDAAPAPRAGVRCQRYRIGGHGSHRSGAAVPLQEDRGPDRSPFTRRSPRRAVDGGPHVGVEWVRPRVAVAARKPTEKEPSG